LEKIHFDFNSDFLIEKKILAFKLKRCNSDFNSDCNLVVLIEKKLNFNFNADSLI